MKSLHDIMNQMEATPSPDSWQKLSQRLDMAMPQSPTTSPAAPKTPHATTFVGKTVVKIVAAVIGTATITAGITLAVVSSNKTENVDNQNTTITIQNTTNQPKVATATTEKNYTTHLNEVSHEVETPKNDEKQSTMDMKASPTTETNLPSAQPAAFTPITIAAKPQQISSIGTITLPSLNPIATSAQDDPALQNLTEEDLQIEEPTKLEIPNVFTPNGDGVNDYFVIKGLEQCNIRELIVHNRAGNIVYRNNSYENQWNGDNCVDGVYYYQLTFDSHGIKRTMTGSVTIIRK